MSEIPSVSELVFRLQKLAEDEAADDAVLAAAFRRDMSRVVDFLSKSMEVSEKAHALLANAYSIPTDGEGVRVQSQDAVKLQWALREVGVGDDSGQPCFTV